MGWAGADLPTSKLRTFLLWSLALSIPIYSNFQLNRALGETRKPPDHLFLKQNGKSLDKGQTQKYGSGKTFWRQCILKVPKIVSIGILYETIPN